MDWDFDRQVAGRVVKHRDMKWNSGVSAVGIASGHGYGRDPAGPGSGGAADRSFCVAPLLGAREYWSRHQNRGGSPAVGDV